MVNLNEKLLTIHQILVVPQDFAACYTLLSNTFHPDELDDPARMAADLEVAPGGMVSFIMLARRIADAPEKVVSLIAGCYLSLADTPFASCGAGFIEYLVTHPNFRQQGHASALLSGFELTLQQEAGARGENLGLVMGEVEDDMVAFKLKRGYRLLPGSRYAQPPINFAPQSGEPLSAPLPKLLMVKPGPGMQPGDALPDGLLAAAVWQVFRQRYGLRSQFGPAAENARRWMKEQIWEPFVESLS